MKEFSVDADTTNEDPAPVTLGITGSINVCTVGDLLLKLASAFDRTDDVVIDLSGVTYIDVAGLQLFCSCHRSSIFSNKEFRIIGQDQPAIWDAAASTGYIRKTGCPIDSKQTCIWAIRNSWHESPNQDKAASDSAGGRQVINVSL